MDKANVLPRRARSMAEMAEIQSRMMVPSDFVASIQAYRPRATDVIISPYGKCGTTWLQQTFHTLRTRGDLDFDDISRVVPWIETAKTLGIDLEAAQRAEPRGFKSHLAYGPMPKGAKYIVSLRDPKDAFVSAYRFMEGWFFEPGSISITEFFKGRQQRRGDGSDYWSHLLSWWAQRDNPNVLLLSYEHMTADAPAAIRAVAKFCGISLDDALLDLTLQHTSLAFMLQHKNKFDDLMMREMSEQRCNLPSGSDSAKVRKGGVGGHQQELPPDVSHALDDIWRETVTAKFGFSDYASLENELRQCVR